LNNRKIYKGFGYRISMDDIDRRIINVLQENSRLSFRKIAQHTGVTTATVSARVQELEKKGVIKKYTVLLDYDLLEKVTLLVMVDADLSKIAEVAESVGSLDEVCCVLRVTGRPDLVVLVRCNGHKSAGEFLDTLESIEGVRDAASQVVLETMKEGLCVKMEVVE
jgi:Lrp/AsnC family transcriptional regulator for asnA, asnC and gidA